MATISEMHIVVVADISGSMSSMGDTPRIKLNEFIKEQHGKEQHGEVSIDCWTFSDTHKLLFENKSVAEAHITELTPNGGTALYASLGYIIDKTGQKLANMPEASRPQRVIVVIYTDGEENSSKGEYSGERGRLLVKSKIEHQQSVYSWVFLFLGSNIDAVQNGTSIGITPETCLNYKSNEYGYNAVFRSASQALERVRSVVPSANENHAEVIKRVAFTEEDQQM